MLILMMGSHKEVVRLPLSHKQWMSISYLNYAVLLQQTLMLKGKPRAQNFSIINNWMFPCPMIVHRQKLLDPLLRRRISV